MKLPIMTVFMVLLLLYLFFSVKVLQLYYLNITNL